jgi:hypothetical protein
MSRRNPPIEDDKGALHLENPPRKIFFPYLPSYPQIKLISSKQCAPPAENP